MEQPYGILKLDGVVVASRVTSVVSETGDAILFPEKGTMLVKGLPHLLLAGATWTDDARWMEVMDVGRHVEIRLGNGTLLREGKAKIRSVTKTGYDIDCMYLVGDEFHMHVTPHEARIGAMHLMSVGDVIWDPEQQRIVRG